MPDAPFRYKRLGYVAMNVTDLNRSVAFYRDVVGMDLTAGSDGNIAFFRCTEDHHNLVFYPAAAPGLKRIAFEMESDRDLDAAIAHLRNLGVPFTPTSPAELAQLRQRKGLRFKVPGCGVTFELYSGSEKAATAYAPTVAQILRLGHCVIKINHFDETFPWLTENFGFRISDHIKGEVGEIAFLRCFPSPYHHSLGIARSDGNQLHHFALMVKEIDDIGRANNRLGKAGSEIVYGPGRHVASGSIFLYFLDPDGVTLEYTYGMEEFSEHAPRPARLLPPTYEVADMWGGIPAPKFATVGPIEGAEPKMTKKFEAGAANVF